MAMSASSLKALMVSKVNEVADSYGDGEKSADDAIQALAEAIVEHITADAEVVVTGGSSAGTYKVS